MARDDIAAFVDRSVRNTFALLGIPVHAYCVMPDHLHLLIGNVTPVDLPGIVFKFVKLTGVLALRYFNVELWQWRHYRQVVEDPATMEALALEILDNPRRSGLAPSNYPYRGRIPCES
jgi:REP element-mobilizing transposase RayT